MPINNELPKLSPAFNTVDHSGRVHTDILLTNFLIAALQEKLLTQRNIVKLMQRKDRPNKDM